MCLVATEDALSEAVACKLLAKVNLAGHQLTPLRRNGFGYLKSNFGKFTNAAKNGRRVFMLTDLDNRDCAPSLVAEWTAGVVLPYGFLFRVAVREVESWLIADRNGFAKFLGISPAKISNDIEAIPDPKKYLLHLAEKAKAKVKQDLLPRKGTLAIQGFGYNERLTEFVEEFWSPDSAGAASPSLSKTIARIDTWVSAIPRNAKA